MTISSFIAYFSMLFLATIIPGPSMLLALNHGANHGLTKTIYSGVGNLIGNLIMALLSILGLGILLITSGIIFNVIKWIGVIYLIFIGLRLIIESNKDVRTSDIEYKSKGGKRRSRLFIDGFFIAVSNPKGILFFTALFPQFINVNDTSRNELMIIFITLGIVAFGCYMFYAIFGVRLNKLFHVSLFKKVYNRITGSLFIGIGLIIAFSKK
jgi:homoserine/homoserine lactone efflux protein